MNWDFDDFLKKAEGKAEEIQENDAPVIPIDTKTKPSFPKWFWMAASVVLLLSVGLIFNYNQNSNVENQAQLVENQIKNQKDNFIRENSEHTEQVAVNLPNDSVSGAKKIQFFRKSGCRERLSG
jgi:cell division protein FtsL